MGTVAELGINGADEVCAQQDCNVGNAATDAASLVCDASNPVTLPPATTPQTPATPTPPQATPQLACPQVPGSGCSICGENRCITKTDSIFAFPNQPEVTCGTLQLAGNQGFVPLSQCAELPGLVHNICACKEATSFVAPTGTLVPTPSPTVPACACALKNSGTNIDCGDVAAMNQALTNLGSNSCQSDCSTVICKTSFYIVQAHHDYCLGADVPDFVTSGLHVYEDVCSHCSIFRKTDSSLPSCPAANCDDNSGNAAYSALLTSGCLNDCNTDASCGNAFRTLRATYDTCPDGTLGTVAELGINGADEVCAQQDCNVGNAATDAASLVCDASNPVTLPPATTPQTPATPTPPQATPQLACPQVPGSGCSICGENRCITKTDSIFAFPNQPEVTCGTLQLAGNQGFVPLSQCAELPGLVHNICACKEATSFVAPTGTPVPSPTVFIPKPTFSPAQQEDDILMPLPGKKSLDTGAIVGVVLAVLVGVSLIVGVVAYTASRHAGGKEQPDRGIETAEQPAEEAVSKDLEIS